MLLEKITARISSISLVTNYKQKEMLEEFLNKFDDNDVIIDIGTSNRRLKENVLNLDLEKNQFVDIIADVHDIPLEDSSVDAVIVTGLIEHIKNPVSAVDELYRILKPNGTIFASVPFIQPYHPHPTDFQRFTIEGIEMLFNKFETIELIKTRGSGSTISWILQEFFSILFSFNNKKAYKILKVFFAYVFYLLKYLDKLLEKNQFDYIIASSFTYIGRKNGF